MQLAAKQKVDKSLLQNNQWSSFLFPKNDSDLINIRSRSLSLRLINSAMNDVILIYHQQNNLYP